MSDLIPSDELKSWLRRVPEWDHKSHKNKALSRTVEFDDYLDGIDFVNNVTDISEELDHHPDIDIRPGKVTVKTTTHTEGGLTELDFELAERIDNLID